MVDKTLDVSGEIGQSLQGKPCWYASSGGAAGPTFQLAFGEKVPREQELRNELHSEDYRRFEGETNLLVWCTWRLDDSAGPISSSDDVTERITHALNRLVGTTVQDVEIEMPAWDLQLGFSNGLRLHVFCDHLPGEPSFDGNWELWLRDKIVTVGPGSVCEVEPR